MQRACHTQSWTISDIISTKQLDRIREETARFLMLWKKIANIEATNLNKRDCVAMA